MVKIIPGHIYRFKIPNTVDYVGRVTNVRDDLVRTAVITSPLAHNKVRDLEDHPRVIVEPGYILKHWGSITEVSLEDLPLFIGWNGHSMEYKKLLAEMHPPVE